MKDDVQTSSWMFWHKRRYVVAILAFVGYVILQSSRANLSVTIIDMTNNKSHTDDNGTTRYKQEFDWDTKLQGHLLSSFFYGYMSTQIIGGWLAPRVGGNRVFGFGILGSSFLTIITPSLTEINVSLLFTLRIMQGIFQIIVHPWKKFFTSAPVWAIVAAHTCDNWGFYAMFTELPAFMKDEFGYSLEESGIISFLPYFLMALLMIYTGRLGDWLMTKGNLTTTQVRKLYCCGTYFIQAVLMILIATIHNITVNLVCLCITIVLGGVSWSSFSANYIDLAPRHASILIGLANTVATLPGIVSPAMTGYIVQHHVTSEWEIVFYIVSAFYVFAGAFYGIFGSGEQQSWASDDICKIADSKSKT